MKKAFSLIELSIVILIIGILIAGVTQSSRLVKQFRLKTAQTLTQSSPVSSIKDLSLWYETSLDSSFKEADKTDSAPVTTWYDNNPQSGYKNNAVQATTANQPLYIEDAINGVPAVRFDGSNDSLPFSGDIIINTGYSLFVVEQRRASTATYVLAGTVGTTNGLLHFGYRSSTVFTFGQWSNDIDYSSIPSYSSPTPRIHTAILSLTEGKKYWLNGGSDGVTPSQSNSGQTAPMVSYVGSAIGGTTAAGLFNGDIGEIILFTRALKTEERQAVEKYLSKKYNISVKP